MIEVLTSNTPNGKKITIMLEEIGYEYKITKININKDEQFKPEFQRISPFRKIPVIIDHEKNISLFESGAILIYLAEKSGKFYDQDKRTVINQWLIGQMAYVGPMLGQHHQFHHYNPGKSKFGEERYFKICERIYLELDMRLNDFSFCIELPIKAKKKNYILSNLPSIERSRIAGVKKVNEFRDGLLILISILRLLILKK